MAQATQQPTIGLQQMIRRLRRKRGFSARSLSLEAGLSESYVGKLEKGELKDVSLRAFARLAAALELTPMETAVLAMSALTPEPINTADRR